MNIDSFSLISKCDEDMLDLPKKTLYEEGKVIRNKVRLVA